jgi:hypothetical protein
MSAALHDAVVVENAVPAFVPAELERLYRNIFASCLAEHVQEADTHTYIAGTGASRTILLFKMRGCKVTVLNSAISFAPAVIQAFVAFIFEHYPSIRAVCFISVATGQLEGAHPVQRFRASEDYVLRLPLTVDAFDSRLGKATASGLRTKARRLARDFPKFDFRILEGADIDSRVVEDIIRLKDEGSAGRGALDANQKNWLRQVVRSHGLVGVSCIDGRVCAGAICTRIGTQLFMHVLSHDRAFDAYSLGMLNSYLTVCGGIERGGQDFHFLWGHGVWKTRLKADERPLDNLVVYRSRVSRLACADVFAAMLLSKFWRRLKSGLLDACAPENRHAWLLRPCLDLWRRFAKARA